VDIFVLFSVHLLLCLLKAFRAEGGLLCHVKFVLIQFGLINLLIIKDTVLKTSLVIEYKLFYSLRVLCTLRTFIIISWRKRT
jgi:hypothetical protein